MMKTSRTARAHRRESVLVIAEQGVDLVKRLGDLGQRGCLIDKLVQEDGEDGSAFRERVASHLSSSSEAVHDRTLFVAREPIGPRLHGMVRSIVSAMPTGAHLVLCADQPSSFATLALSALALTVKELTHGAHVSVEGQPVRVTDPQRAWRRRIDKVLDGLLVEPSAMRQAG